MIALPAYIDPEIWAEYESMRRRIKKPMSDLSTRRHLKRAQELKDAGYDVNESIFQAAEAGWLDFYIPRDKSLSETPERTRDRQIEEQRRQHQERAKQIAPREKVVEIMKRFGRA